MGAVTKETKNWIVIKLHYLNIAIGIIPAWCQKLVFEKRVRECRQGHTQTSGKNLDQCGAGRPPLRQPEYLIGGGTIEKWCYPIWIPANQRLVQEKRGATFSGGWKMSKDAQFGRAADRVWRAAQKIAVACDDGTCSRELAALHGPKRYKILVYTCRLPITSSSFNSSSLKQVVETKWVSVPELSWIMFLRWVFTAVQMFHLQSYPW